MATGLDFALDSTGQLDEVLGLAEHLRDALWRVDSSGARPVDATGGVIVAGMGGSASGARLAQGALGPRLTRPLAVSEADPPMPATITPPVASTGRAPEESTRQSASRRCSARPRTSSN